MYTDTKSFKNHPLLRSRVEEKCVYINRPVIWFSPKYKISRVKVSAIIIYCDVSDTDIQSFMAPTNED